MSARSEVEKGMLNSRPPFRDCDLVPGRISVTVMRSYILPVILSTIVFAGCGAAPGPADGDPTPGQTANVNDNGDGGEDFVADAGDEVMLIIGEDTTLQGSASGGTPPYAYRWFTEGWSSTEQNPIVEPLKSTTYTLEVTDANNNSETGSVTVTVVPGELSTQADADDLTIVDGQCTTLLGSASGGEPPYEFDWSAPGWGGSTAQDPTVCPADTTTYILTVTDSAGETDTDTVTVTVCQPDLSFLNGILDGTARPINFAPTDFDPTIGEFPTEEQIEANLLRLYEDGFRGILTFGVDGTLATAPRIAREIGFEVVGVGVWDVNDQDQIDTAVGLAGYTDFFILGSEGILSGRYTLQELADAIDAVRNRTCKSVTTSEPWDVLLSNTDIVDMVDFVAVNIYGWWEGAHEPQDAVELLLEHFEDVEDAAAGKVAIVRETGFPTGGHPDASVCKQHEYFEALEETGIPYVTFEFADQAWKHEDHQGYDVGPHWGRYDQYGEYKHCDDNSAPVAQDQSVSTPFQTAIDIVLIATDPDDDYLTYSIESGPLYGTLSGTPPALTYAPNAGFFGEDIFTFIANDGQLDSNVGTVTITVGEPPPCAIEFTFVPPIGSFLNLQGITYGVNYVTHAVVVYIKVDGVWWVKPYEAWPLTTILPDGTWICDITTGGDDPSATEIRAFVVSSDYDASLHSLPEEGDYVAFASVTR